MGIRANKAIVRALTKVSNQGDFEGSLKYMAPDYVYNGQPSDREADRAQSAAMLAAFPNGRITLDEMIGNGDKVVVRWTLKGTHKGAFMGAKPTGKRIRMEGISIYTFKNGLVVGVREQYDKYGFLEQLGLIPASG